jgi:hypothetical protein
MIQLSILIPSIPSRFDKAQALYSRLLTASANKRIEILLLMDNKVMTIGEKCNHLMDASRGKYFCFIHDDDELVSLSAIYRATFKNVDVIDYKAKCRNDDGSTYIVTQRLGNEVEHRTKDGRYLNMNRPPFPNCVWHNKFRQFRFPHISYGEDWEFIRQCLEVAETEHYINKVLFHYNFDPKVTEASTESNECWTNPN